MQRSFLIKYGQPSHGLGPTKMPLVKHQEYAMYCDSSLAPTFGGGHDLHVHMAENANTATSCYSHLGYSYECHLGQRETFLTRVWNFTVTDYEVFGFN